MPNTINLIATWNRCLVCIVGLYAAVTLSACQTVSSSAHPVVRETPQNLDQQTETHNLREEEPHLTVRTLNIAELPDTIRQEHEDRTNRLARLSRQYGAPAPTVQDNLQVDAGTLPGVTHAVPVIRVRYSDMVFFDTAKSEVKPEAKPILDVLAAAMSRDLPDTSLLILGHTDSRGSNAYNAGLSLARAKAVMIELANRGVHIEQMATIGIGEMQPVASNSDEKGMALNRRVEFMLSRFLDANLRLVEETEVNSNFLDDHKRVTLNEDKNHKISAPPKSDPVEIRKEETTLKVVEGKSLVTTKQDYAPDISTRRDHVLEVVLRKPVVIGLKRDEKNAPAQTL